MDDSEPVSCVVCEDNEEKEILSKCYVAGFKTLKAHAVALGLNDLLSRINTNWDSGNLMIHQTCRMSLKNLSTEQKQQQKRK